MKVIKHTEEIVRQVMTNYPETRASNDDLVIKVLEQYGLVLTPQQIQAFKNAPSFESITRCRRKIQAGGELQADFQTRINRMKKEQEYREYSNPEKYFYIGNVAYKKD